VDDGFHLWSERYDREMTDVFAIQDEISQKIAEKLRVRLAKPGPFAKRYTKNVEAYNLYLRGHYHLLKASTEGMAKGKEYLQQALALDPDYALAWYGLAVFHWEQRHMGIIPPREAYRQSRQASSRALELDKMMPEAHAIAGVLRAADFDWKEAEHEFRRALELDPKSSDAAFWYTWSYLIPMKRLEESIITVRKALDLDPLSPLLQWCLGYVFHLKGEWEQAIEQCQNSLELDTNYTQPLLNLGAIYLMTGELDLAIQAFERASNLTGRSPLMLGYLGFGYARAGRIEEAQGLIDELNDRARNACEPSSSIARIHLGLGEIDRCVTRLEQSIDERDGSTIYFHVEPICEPLRSHPRYHALMRKMNLEARCP
jgi:serine/threonine-protein kinase